jgi:hypothetical protein
MLIVESQELPPGDVNVNSLLKNKNVKIAADEFSAKPRCFVSARQKSICVLQYEAATVPFDAMITVGSEAATTCVIALIVGNHGCTVLHFDEDTVHNPEYLDRALLMSHNGADLYLVGGYEDENGTSRGIVEALLAWLHNQNNHFRLLVACVLKHNTKKTSDGKHSIPKITSICISADTLKVSPAKFESRGPMIDQRSCRCLVGNQEETVDLFDMDTHEFTMHPFYFCLGDEMKTSFLEMGELSDKELLPLVSTSQYAEDIGFAENFRLLLKYVCMYPNSNSMFRRSMDGSAERFTWNGKEWTRPQDRVRSGHTAGWMGTDHTRFASDITERVMSRLGRMKMGL